MRARWWVVVGWWGGGVLFYFGFAQALHRKWSEESVGWQVRTFIGGSPRVTSVAFSADAKRIVSGADMRVKIFDVETGAEVSTFVVLR